VPALCCCRRGRCICDAGRWQVNAHHKVTALDGFADAAGWYEKKSEIDERGCDEWAFLEWASEAETCKANSKVTWMEAGIGFGDQPITSSSANSIQFSIHRTDPFARGVR